jgi:hypothetical protein
VTAVWRPFKLDLAYVYDLGKARVGNLFGTSSHSVIATLTYDYASPFGETRPAH